MLNRLNDKEENRVLPTQSIQTYRLLRKSSDYLFLSLKSSNVTIEHYSDGCDFVCRHYHCHIDYTYTGKCQSSIFASLCLRSTHIYNSVKKRTLKALNRKCWNEKNVDGINTCRWFDRIHIWIAIRRESNAHYHKSAFLWI